MEPNTVQQITSAVAEGVTETVYLSQTSKIWLLIGVRFILVSMLAIAGMVAVISAYNWINSEGNDVKKYENKALLGNAVIMITVLFVLMSIYHYFVPDYSALSL